MMAKTLIELTTDEITQAALVGVLRQVFNVEKKKKHLHNIDANAKGWQMHIEGALGECALAKYLGVYWAGVGERGPDVGDVDVRTTKYRSGTLILHDDDNDNRKFYLATGENGKYTIRGWIMARDGKKTKFWRHKGERVREAAYFVPQWALTLEEQDEKIQTNSDGASVRTPMDQDNARS